MTRTPLPSEPGSGRTTGPDALELRRFSVQGTTGAGSQAAAAWLRAVGLGFYDPRRPDDQVEAILAGYSVDARELSGVYQSGPVAEHSLSADVPVATFGSLRKNLNVGYGQQLPAHLITAVTVRTSHRRRGLLRWMMTEDLTRAAAEGVAVAALMASEASIYGRYGFGVATFEHTVTVDTSSKFRLREIPAGSVEVVDRGVLLEVAPAVFGRAHARMPGSLDRQEMYRHRVSGTFGPDGRPDETIRAALHYGPDGDMDGYVAYKFTGWEATPPAMEVVDLIAATPDAYLGLWQFLASIDLVEQVTWSQAPADDPLVWALVDGRCVHTTDVRDMLWLRILDVPSALGARKYASDGRLVLSVSDPLGLASGTVVLSVADGDASVTAAPGAAPDLSMGIDVLSSLYLGGVNSVTLRDAGLIHEHTSGAAEAVLRMFAAERPPRCQTHF